MLRQKAVLLVGGGELLVTVHAVRKTSLTALPCVMPLFKTCIVSQNGPPSRRLSVFGQRLMQYHDPTQPLGMTPALNLLNCCPLCCNFENASIHMICTVYPHAKRASCAPNLACCTLSRRCHDVYLLSRGRRRLQNSDPEHRLEAFLFRRT